MSIFLISAVLNITLSAGIIYDNLNYSGSKLTEADIPLAEKMDVTNFIAEDMNVKKINSATISYDLGGGIWDWIPEHSETFSEWYPKYPYTIGRAYDYILLNQHSKKNIYEGLNDRNFQDSQYIVSYIFNTEKLYQEAD